MSQNALEKAWSDHSQLWNQNIWVYPVISRRAGGISIGINLNLDKRCTFRCAYCQVDRSVPGPQIPNDIVRIRQELEQIFKSYEENGLENFTPFQGVDKDKRLIRDICLSGDGESTMAKEFPDVCRLMREAQDKFSQYPLKLTLITNATLLDRPDVRKGLRVLTEKRGEIWAKLDAGSDDWYEKIDGSHIALERIQKNIEGAVREFPLRIQTMLCKIGDSRPDAKELDLYTERLKRIHAVNPKNFLGVQLYSVVRHTASRSVHPLEREFFEAAAMKIRKAIPVEVDIY